MTYEELNITVLIALGNRAAAALNENGQLLIIQAGKSGQTESVINLGILTQARAREISEYFERLARLGGV